MTTFLLIRHGNNDWVGKALAGWTPGVHLNGEGKEQALRLAERLSGVCLHAIYSSPLERARETAAPLAARLGLEVRICKDFGEIHTGDWTGRQIADLDRETLWQRFNAFRGGTRMPGGEHMIEIQARMVAGLERLRDEHPDQTVAVVSHGDPIRAVLAHYAGIPLDLCLRLDVDPASVSVIKVAEWGPRIVRVNDTTA